MKKLIFINRYYYPDISATAQLLHDLILHLDEVEVCVITGRYTYNQNSEALPACEIIGNASVHRVWTSNNGRKGLVGRAVDYLTFYIMAFFKLLSLAKKGDIVIAKTDPPMISVIAAFVCKVKGARLINWLQDIFPEVASRLGVKVLKQSLVNKVVTGLRNYSINNASHNVVLDDSMQAFVVKNVSERATTRIIHNWPIEELDCIDSAENHLIQEWGLADKFIVGYSGNLGRAHDYPSIFEAIKLLRDDKEIVFLFVGGGAGYDWLLEKVKQEKLENVVFKPYQPKDQLSYSLSVPHIHLLSLITSLDGLIVPSKFYGILSVGKPMVMVGSQDAGLGKLIKEQGIGDVVACDQPELLKECILALKNKPSRVEEHAANCLALNQHHFGRQNSIAQWKQLLQEALDA